MSNQKGSNLNLSTTIRWIALIPWQYINPNYKSTNVAFNLSSFTLPEVTLGSNEITNFGYPIEFPNYTITTNKILTFEYILSTDFHQYEMLWNWANQIVVKDGSGAPNPINENSSFRLPIRFIALTEFKKPIFEVLYKDCWVKEIGNISWDYQDDGASVIKHSFTCAYANFDFTHH
jgi:hypothetical protein